MNELAVNCLRGRSFMILTTLLCGLLPASAADISGLEVGQVGTSTFQASWTVTDPDTIPGLQLFVDAEMTQPYSGVAELEWAPVPQLGTPDLPGTYAQRTLAGAVRESMRQRGRVLVRVGGLAPGASLFAQALALDPVDQTVVADSAPVAVTLATRSRLVRESRQLLLSLTALDPAGRQGALVRVSATGSPYPLYGVLVDTGDVAQASIDLTAFLDASGTTQISVADALDLTIEVADLALDPLVQPVAYDGSFLVAAHTPILLASPEPEVAGYVFELIANQRVNVPFTITVRAVDATGAPVAGFSEPVVLAGSGPVALGAGTTPPFSEGSLTGHAVRIDQSGPYQLSVADALGRTGTSNAFEVLQLNLSAMSYEEWSLEYFLRNAYNPEIAGFERDPDLDRINNLLEFAFGRIPTADEESYRMPYITTNTDGSMDYHYFRRTGHPDLTYTVFASADLQPGSWTVLAPEPGSMTVTPQDDQVERVTIRLPAGTRLYIRIIVTL